ncbi:MAG TPA: type 1 glutamine amidotransferase domain-containing protein [Myxococcus sp.]|nr:type 1 glutamine amidotransferase domain-containing protein [Myxococcus sp.]
MHRTQPRRFILSALLALILPALAGCGEDADKRVLLVVSNHGELGTTGQKTGVWMAELTHPYWKLADSGMDVTLDLASPDGGDAPIDAFSVRFNFDDFLATGQHDSGDPGNTRFLESEATRRWVGTRNVTVTNGDGSTSEAVEYRFTHTLRLAEIDPADYDAIYFAGGNGAMWQLPGSEDVHQAVREFYESGKLVSAACHGTAALLNTKLSDGSYLVAGRRVTGFSNAEEHYLQQAGVMPLLLQDAFTERGATYVEAEPWKANVVVDGRIISGQNPPSAEGVGEKLVELLASEP